MAPKLAVSTHAGFVAILGAPNAGKSTLLNRLIGQKISIISPKPQTTRMRVLGILAEGQTQIAFIDTPGIFAPKRRLDRAMVNAAWQACEDADAIVLLVDAGARQPDPLTDAIIETLKKKKQKIILALNKIDAIRVEKLLPITVRFQNDSGVWQTPS